MQLLNRTGGGWIDGWVYIYIYILKQKMKSKTQWTTVVLPLHKHFL